MLTEFKGVHEIMLIYETQQLIQNILTILRKRNEAYTIIPANKLSMESERNSDET